MVVRVNVNHMKALNEGADFFFPNLSNYATLYTSSSCLCVDIYFTHKHVL